MQTLGTVAAILLGPATTRGFRIPGGFPAPPPGRNASGALKASGQVSVRSRKVRVLASSRHMS